MEKESDILDEYLELKKKFISEYSKRDFETVLGYLHGYPRSSILMYLEINEKGLPYNRIPKEFKNTGFYPSLDDLKVYNQDPEGFIKRINDNRKINSKFPKSDSYEVVEQLKLIVSDKETILKTLKYVFK